MADWSQFKHVKPFHGLMVATFAPFQDQKCTKLNLGLINSYTKFLVEQKVQGIFVNGTSGESVSLTVDERKQILEAYMQTPEVKNGQLYVIAQILCESYLDTLELATHAQKQQVQGICMMSPSFFRPKSVEQLAVVIADVAKHVLETPFYYYFIPQMNQLNYPVLQTLDLVKQKAKNIVGCKFTSPDCGESGYITSAGYTALLGNDGMVLSGFASGCQGAIGLYQNILGPLTRDIYDLFLENKIQEATEKQQLCNKIINFVSSEIGSSASQQIGAVKFLLKYLYGFDFGPLRWPQKSEEEHKLLNLGQKFKNLLFAEKYLLTSTDRNLHDNHKENQQSSSSLKRKASHDVQLEGKNSQKKVHKE